MNHRTVQILDILRCSGTAVSGEAICERLGISRSAVWKHIESLRSHGCRIDSAPRRGYRLAAAPDLLLAPEIEAARSGRRLGTPVRHRQELDSTNRLAISLADDGASEGTLVVADHQTAGRGRLRRTWHSVPGQSIAMSVILRPAVSPFRVPQLSLVAAVAGAQALEQECGVDVRVKWPNDLYIGNRKVAGMLCEMEAELDRLRFLVLGIGINVRIPAEGFPADCAETATSLENEASRSLHRGRIIIEILDRLEEAYGMWLRAGLAPFREAWRQRSFLLGKRILVTAGPPQSGRGIVRDLREDGALLIEAPDGELHALYSGDVTLHNAMRPSVGSHDARE